MSKDKFLDGVSRRTFFSAAAGVFGAASVARPSRRVDADFPTSDGFVVSHELHRCVKCGRLGGHVLERYNGTVPVLCRCRRTARGVPSMSSTRNDALVWTPTTHHKGPDGRLWHTPYFVGMLLS